MSSDSFIEQMRRRLLMQKVVGREVWGEIKVGPEELRAHYRANKDQFLQPEKRHLREIIVLESSGQGEQELADLATSFRQQLADGTSLGELAAQHSESGLTTGVIDLGWLRESELEKTLAEAAWALEVGKFAQPVKARGGFHLLYLVEAEPESFTPFEEVEDQIRSRERSQRFNQELEVYMAKLEKGAFVREDLPLEAVGYRSSLDDYQEEQDFDFFSEPTLATDEKEAEQDSPEQN
jgi:parvulin-like peptidyl-prolyl isomerase